MRLNIKRSNWVTAPNASKLWICIPVFYTLFIQTLTGFPRPGTLHEVFLSRRLLLGRNRALARIGVAYGAMPSSQPTHRVAQCCQVLSYNPIHLAGRGYLG